MAIADDLHMIAQQEHELLFPTFDEANAWQLGQFLREWGQTNGAPIAIDIRTFNRPLFFAALPGSAPDNTDWIRRKSNMVDRYRRSSYAIGLDLKAKGTTLTERYGLSLQDYAPYGGAFPIILDKTGIIGSVTVSGLDQREDHNLVVTALCVALGLDPKQHTLESNIP
ncbi:heme-degrading domain-containing protein [Novacetimonas hansenii]|uniref:heme-degrading domain-containing protein n=1 Tax=Novacetimonas hansenii TaxID=436 RepID=UPI0017828881|nr:heme-degrading domain-containing protein [Novacetimonas hansenii]MBL7235558.1 heme-degrading domain-containing protein [Novacetimonas hansenii]QOF94448.1 heme-degrading domain-containing protein [Novacetimonas hansenii]